MKKINLFDNDTIKWRSGDKLYCAHIQADSTPMNPRRGWDNLATMACWYNGYDLGDDIGNKSPEEFWLDLVDKHVPRAAFIEAVKSGKLYGIRAETNDRENYDIYEYYAVRSILGTSEPDEVLEYENLSESDFWLYISDDLTVQHCQKLLEPYLEWMPLTVYEHGGITMSCGPRVGQFADRWDSSAVGWIVVSKETIEAETGPKDEDWRQRAARFMKAEVETYDRYLTGDTYGFTLYRAEVPAEGEDPAWEEVESCWGLYGSEIHENGLIDHLPYAEAIEAGDYKTGQATEHTVTYYTF